MFDPFKSLGRTIWGWVRFAISKPVIVTLLLLIQVWLLINAIIGLGTYSYYLYLFFILLSYIVTLRLLNGPDNPAFKLALIIPIMIFPVFGGPFYLIFGNNRIGRRERRIFNLAWGRVASWLRQKPEVLERLELKDRQLAGQARYISTMSQFPVYQGTSCSYLPSGDAFFEEALRAMENARKYIFVEFFIIRPGKLWDEMLEILERKAAEGVDVRLVYDDMGCTFQLPQDYYRVLRSKGIKCSVFNPYRPTLSLSFNHRDHRKIIIIDGYIGFTGGINIDDQYADSYSGRTWGTWCDSGVKLQGEGVWNLTMMFLQAWNYEYPEAEDMEQLRPWRNHPAAFADDGFIQPFGDTPFDGEAVSETAYMNIINQAVDYLLITTPYLVISNEMMTALCMAVKRGVKVSILTPSNVENWLIYSATEASFEPLLKAGVEVYRYTPGFLHGKNLLCDDKVGIVGSINLDFRSMYLSFECGVWMTDCSALKDLKRDLEQRFAASEKLTPEVYRTRPLYKRVAQTLIKTLAPLL